MKVQRWVERRERRGECKFASTAETERRSMKMSLRLDESTMSIEDETADAGFKEQAEYAG